MLVIKNDSLLVVLYQFNWCLSIIDSFLTSTQLGKKLVNVIIIVIIILFNSGTRPITTHTRTNTYTQAHIKRRKKNQYAACIKSTKHKRQCRDSKTTQPSTYKHACNLVSFDRLHTISY